MRKDGKKENNKGTLWEDVRDKQKGKEKEREKDTKWSYY